MKIFLIILTFYFSLAFSQTKPSVQALKPNRKPSQLEVISFWKIVAADGQFFSLSIEKLNKDKGYFVSFGRGERTLEKMPAPEKEWLQWRKQLTIFTEEATSATGCPHPLSVVIAIDQRSPKEKEICNEDISKEKTSKMAGLIEELKGYLFGK
jgi:hypothetical protein